MKNNIKKEFIFLIIISASVSLFPMQQVNLHVDEQLETVANNNNNNPTAVTKPRKLTDLKKLCYKTLMNNSTHQELSDLTAKRNFDVHQYFESTEWIAAKRAQFETKAAQQLIGQIKPTEFIEPKKFKHDRLKTLTFSNDSKKIATWHNEYINVWSLNANENSVMPVDYKSDCSSNYMVYSPNDQQIAICCGELIILDVTQKTKIKGLPKFLHLMHISYCDDDNLMFTAPRENLSILNLTTREKRKVYNQHAVDFDYNRLRNALITADENTKRTIIKFWHNIDADPIDILSPDYPIWYYKLNPDATKFITGANKGYKQYSGDESYHGLIKLWDVEKNNYIYCFDPHACIRALAYCSNNEFIAHATYPDPTKIVLTHTQQPKPIGTVNNPHSIERQCLRYSPDGLFLAAGSKHLIHVYDMRMIPQIFGAVKTMTQKDLNKQCPQLEELKK